MEHSSITKLDQATRMLAEVRTIDDATQLIDLAEAARVYARQVELGLEAQNHAAEIKLRAQRKAGEILTGMEKANGAQGTGSNQYQKVRLQDETAPPTYAELGILKRDAHQWQTIAKLPDAEFETLIHDTKTSDKELTTRGVYAAAKSSVIESARSKMAEDVADIPQDITLLVGDFREALQDWQPNSIDTIFTDPPYDQESIPLYGDLAKIAARILKPGGSLIVYAGHYALPQYSELMTPHLRYWWILSLKHGGNSARLIGKNVFVEWKPLLWFVKERRANTEYISDFFESEPPTKIEHEWQQSSKEAEYYINHLTNPGDTVLDPFAGSGTTLIAAHRTGRKAVGVELNNERANICRSRIQAECSVSATQET